MRPKKELSIEYILCEARAGLKFSIEHKMAYPDGSTPTDELAFVLLWNKENTEKRGRGVTPEYYGRTSFLLLLMLLLIELFKSYLLF